MSMYSSFQTNDDLEKGGVELDYGSFRIRIARAGGANKKYAKVMEAKSRPHRRALAANTMHEDVAMDILYQAYAESIVVGWTVKSQEEKNEDKDVWVSAIEGKDGKNISFTPENVVATFKALPELFIAVKDAAEQAATFRVDDLEQEAKN